MTNKKPTTRTTASAHQPAKLDAVTLSNMAHQPKSSGIVPHDDDDDDALQRISDMLAKLSPSNVDLVTNIIQAIVDQQIHEK
jgi:3-methyladenine DNA glycosylase/8-oxoguanine DNA glycosylase